MNMLKAVDAFCNRHKAKRHPIPGGYRIYVQNALYIIKSVEELQSLERHITRRHHG